jgi:serine/threonine protein kinase
MEDFYNTDDTVAGGIFGELRDMFAVKDKGLATIQMHDRTIVALEEIEFGDVVRGGWNAAVFKTRLAVQEQPEVDNMDAHLSEVEEQQQVTCIELSADHTESLIADAMEDTEVSFEEVLNETMETIKEQRKELSKLHAVVCSHSLQLRNLCAQEIIYPELLESFEGLAAIDEDTVDGFALVLMDDMMQDKRASRPILEDTADDPDDVSSVRSSLSCLSECLDELEAAVNMVEQQHLELVHLHQILDVQKSVLHGFLAPADLLDEGLPRTRMKSQEATSEISDHLKELDDESIFPVRNKLELELVGETVYKFAVKVCPLVSCSADHLRRMLRKELLPALSGSLKFGKELDIWHFPAHFNIVELYGGYVAPLSDVRALGGLNVPGILQWPAVESSNEGSAVCVAMKWYEFTLAEFLASHSPGIVESSLLLLQLLEAVVHLGVHDICHRNLNTNNILVEATSTGYHLVISNFGQSICGDGLFGLHVPYVTDETCKGGCLLAPEIAAAEKFSFLNYRKADLWAVGVIAYEIFGGRNPFRTASGLVAENYQEQDLPDLPLNVPQVINNLIKSMLRRNPNERPEPVIVANALHVLLWAPEDLVVSWQRKDKTHLLDFEIRRWIVQFAAVLHCGQFGKNGDASVVETLQQMFLSRADSQLIHDAVQLLQR